MNVVAAVCDVNKIRQDNGMSCYLCRKGVFVKNGAVLALTIVALGLGGCDTETSAKVNVEIICENLSSPNSSEISMRAMESLFGEAKADEWCTCAYNTVSKEFSAEQIVAADGAGTLDPVNQALPKSVALATASCMAKSDVPEQGKPIRDAFVNWLRASNE